ncbi:MAG TPA: homoserine O-succinyltransferase [Prolixibacteraceae bacterium]|nr:homoserine O-succinyltransferase [Prolixibacteraceae bacterium]
MPLNLPDGLPAIDLLREENIFVMNETRAAHQDIRPLKIIILNLMPLKIATETDLLRLLSNSPIQIEIYFLQIEGHISKNTSLDHLNTFYHTFSEIKENKYDGMIITGAPVEHLPFEEVDYWEDICKIFDWANHNVTSTMFICWAAQAGLHYHYGIPKYPLEKKMFGIFNHNHSDLKLPIFRGFDDVFRAPHSRHTEIHAEDILKVSEIELISQSDEAGVYMVIANNGKQLFVTGHPEYSRGTLNQEYQRDFGKGLPIDLPFNYYKEDDSSQAPVLSWRSHANLLFLNWLNYYVYQETPYDLHDIK